MNNWINNNPEKVMILLFLNMVIPPIILIALGFSEMGKDYFVALGIGLPWIITTAGQLIYYRKPEKAKEYLDRCKADLERQRALKRAGSNIEIWIRNIKRLKRDI
jgi:hypothetical protein